MKISRLCSVLVMCAAMQLTFVANAGATTVHQKPISELISESSFIVLGTAVHVDIKAGIESPETETAIEVEYDFGTEAPSVMTYNLPEGQFDGTHVQIESAPKLLEERQYLIFFRQGPWSLTPYTNWKYSVFVVGEEYMFDLEGHCIVGFGNYVEFGERLRYPAHSRADRRREATLY